MAEPQRAGRQRSIEGAILGGFGVALLILIAIGVVSFQSTVNVEAAVAARAHSNDVRFALQGLLSSLQDAETSQRGFVITGDESYLSTYGAAVDSARALVTSLRNLTAGNPTQQQQLAALGPLVSAKLTELQTTIDLRHAQGFGAAQAVVLNNSGQQNMNNIRALLGQMQSDEDQQYQARDAALAAQLASVRGVVVGGSVLAVLVTLVSLGTIGRELRRRRRAEGALAAQAQELARERDLLQVLLDNLPDTIYFKDRASRFTRINRAQARVLGVPEPAAAVGKSDFDFQPASVSQPSFEREQQILATGEPLIDWIEYVPTADGAPRWFSSTKIPIRDQAGQVTGLVGLSRDVTEHQQAQAALEAGVQQRTRLLRMLSECNQSLVRANDELGLLQDICRCLVQFGGYRLAWVGLAQAGEPGRLRTAAQAASAAEGQPPAAEGGPPAEALRTGQPLITHTLNTDPAWAPWQALAAWAGAAAAIVLPFGPESEPLGVLAVLAAQAAAFEPAEVTLLAELAGDLNYGLRTLRTRAALDRGAERAQALASLSKDLAEVSTNYTAALETLARLLAERVGDGCALYLVSDDGQFLETAAMTHRDPAAARALEAIKAATPARADEGLSGQVLRSGQTLLIPEVNQAQLRASLPLEYGPYLEHYSIYSLLCVALRAEGRSLGTLVMSRSTPERAYTADDQTFLEEVAGRAALVISNARLYAGLEQHVRERTQALEAEIAERKRAEEEIRRTGRFLESIIENIPDMIFVKDARELRFVRFNRAGEALLGFARADMLGKNDYDFFPPAEADFFTAKDRQVLDGRQLEDIPEEPIQTRLQGERTLHTKKLPILGEDGQPAYLLGISEDITERKRAEAEIRALNQALGQKVVLLDAANHEMEAFSYSVSHDLRAPLRALDGFSQILMEDYAEQVDAQGRNYLQRVRAASQKMGELIDALLALARLGRGEMRHEPVDLSALAQAALADLHAADPTRPVELVVAEGLSAQGDPRLLRAVLENLLGNAWKFTSKTANARIEFGSQPAATEAAASAERTFFVRDNGAGFDMAHADRLFSAFQRLHQQADFSGSGIGLATVQRVISRHGGRVWAEGQPGQGATFYFTLPAA